LKNWRVSYNDRYTQKIVKNDTEIKGLKNMSTLYLNLTGLNLSYSSTSLSSKFEESILIKCISRGSSILFVNEEYVFTTEGPLRSVNHDKKYFPLSCSLQIMNEENTKIEDFLLEENLELF